MRPGGCRTVPPFWITCNASPTQWASPLTIKPLEDTILTENMLRGRRRGGRGKNGEEEGGEEKEEKRGRVNGVYLLKTRGTHTLHLSIMGQLYSS